MPNAETLLAEDWAYEALRDDAEAIVLTMAGDDFLLGESGRRGLEDDEYFVRRRIHREVRAALGQEA